MYRVQGDSMLPTLHNGDYLLAQASAAGSLSLSRGSIVAVSTEERLQIKRVIGLPGERIKFAEGTLSIGGKRLAEPYLRGLPPYLGLDSKQYELECDEYFIMGDNRAHSTDSRHFGPVRGSQIEGTAIFRVWPPIRFGKL